MSSRKLVGSKSSCRKAIERVKARLLDHPQVVGLGIVREKEIEGHCVAVYVSSLPQTEQDRKAIPDRLDVESSNEEVAVKIIEIGVISKEDSGPQSQTRSLGKEPL